MFFPLFFWLPAIASAPALVFLWNAVEISPRAAAILGAWFLAALLLELLEPAFSRPWALGLVAQTMLAIGLIMKWRVSR
jgi:hypothetical protein